jgi:hypothetical protein
MSLAEAFALFRRLGVNAETLNPRDFSTIYFVLAKRYQPDWNLRGSELMANISAASNDFEILPKFSFVTSIQQRTDLHRVTAYPNHLDARGGLGEAGWWSANHAPCLEGEPR